MIETILQAESLKKERRLYISCAKAFEIAKKYNISLQETGKKCNELKIKITNCQLGCFGNK